MKTLKFIGKSLFGLFLTILALWILAFGTLQTRTGQTWVLNYVIHQIEESTQTKITIQNFYFSFPLNLQLKDLKIAREDQTLLTIHEAELTCAFHHLLEGRLIFSSIQLADIHLFHLPDLEIGQSQNAQQESTPWDKPIFPFYVKIEKMNIQRLHLSPAIVEKLPFPKEITEMTGHSTLSLQGMMSNNPFKKSVIAHLLLTIQDAQSDTSSFSLAVDAQNHQLSLSLHLNPLPPQLIQWDLPSSIRTRLAFYASAPVNSWQKTFENRSQTDDAPIEGHFKLTFESSENDLLYSTLIGSKSSFKSHFTLTPSRDLDLKGLKIKSPYLIFTGDALLTEDGKIQHSTFQGEIISLHHLKELLAHDLQGKLTFEGHATGSLQSPSIDIHFQSPSMLFSQHAFENIKSSAKISSTSHGIAGDLTLDFEHQAKPCQAAGSLDWNDKKGLTLSNLRLDALGLNLKGELSCSPQDSIWEGSLEAYTDNFELLSRLLKTPVKGKMHLKTLLKAAGNNQQGIRVELTGYQMQWTDLQAEEVRVHAETQSFNAKNQTFPVHSSIELAQARWKDAVIERAFAEGDCEADLINRTLTELSTHWEAQEINWNSGHIKLANGQIHSPHPLEMNKGTIQASLHDIMTAGIQLDSITGSTALDPAESSWPYKISAMGDEKEPWLVDVEGTWHRQEDLLDIKANQLTGHFGPYRLELLQSGQLQISQKGMQLSDFHLRLAEAELQASFKQEGEEISGQFKTNAIPSELFHFVAPDLPLAGRATFQGSIAGTMQQPTGQMQIELHRVQITEELFAKNPFIEGIINASLDSTGIHLQSELKGIGRSPVALTGKLPISMSLDPFHFTIQKDKPFELNLDAEGELDPYLQLFYNDDINLSGQAKIALKMNGQIDSPQINGFLDIMNGSFESLNTGAIYQNIQARLEGEGSKIVLTQFSAVDKRQGTITATGSITLDPQNNYPYEFHVQPTRIFILDSDYASITASGPMALIGNTKSSKIEGTLTIDQAKIQLEETLPQKIKTVDVKYFNLPEGEELPKYLEPKETNSTIELNVEIKIPNTLTIKGNKIESEWKGEISIKGTPDHPQLFGDMRIVKGTYDFNGKIFNLSQGSIHFAGNPDKKTTMYVVASKDIDRIKAEIIVKGPIDKPAISFRSNPPLSQREVLSYILFNRGISDITMDQGDQLSQSFMALNASDQTSGENDFLSRVRNKIGIDRLDFGTGNAENKDFSMQIGKNITENITVSINQAMNAVAPLVSVEIRLHKNIKAQADGGYIGDDNQFRTSIKWTKDY